MSSSGEADIRTDGVNLLMFSMGGLSPDLNSNQIVIKSSILIGLNHWMSLLPKNYGFQRRCGSCGRRQTEADW